MSVADWGPTTGPGDEWIRSKSSSDLAAWLEARAAGTDGRWNPRDGDDPGDLIRALLLNRGEKVQGQLMAALALALKRRLATGDTRLPASPLIELIDLVGDCGPPMDYALSRSLAEVLTEALATVPPDASATYVAHLLRARAILHPPAPTRLWQRFLTDRTLAVAAFQCALYSTKEVAKESFTRLMELSSPEPIPVLSAQARILRDRIGPHDFERYVNDLISADGPLGGLARTLARDLGVPVDLPPRRGVGRPPATARAGHPLSRDARSIPTGKHNLTHHIFAFVPYYE